MKEIKIKNEIYTKIKELENTIIVAKDGKRYVYHKKKKIIVKRTQVVYEPINKVIRKIENMRAKKELRLNERQKEVFSRWKVKEG